MEFEKCNQTTQADKNAEENSNGMEFFVVENDDSGKEEQIFDFVETPSYATLFTGANAEPLFFLKLIN